MLWPGTVPVPPVAVLGYVLSRHQSAPLPCSQEEAYNQQKVPVQRGAWCESKARELSQIIMLSVCSRGLFQGVFPLQLGEAGVLHSFPST